MKGCLLRVKGSETNPYMLPNGGLPLFVWDLENHTSNVILKIEKVGLNSSQAFEFDPSYSYMFHKNIGVVGGVRFVQEAVDHLHYDFDGPVYQWRASKKKEVSTLRMSIRATKIIKAIRHTFPYFGYHNAAKNDILRLQPLFKRSILGLKRLFHRLFSPEKDVFRNIFTCFQKII